MNRCYLPLVVWCFVGIASADDWVSLMSEDWRDHWYGRPGRMSPDEMAAMDTESRSEAIQKWTGEASEHWSVDEQILLNDGEGNFLVSKQQFGDYELQLEYRTVAKADSGIYLKECPQVQIWDFTDPSKFRLGSNLGSGGLWNQPAGRRGKDPLVLADHRFGQWNHVRVVQVGSRTSVWLNDQCVVDHALMDNYWDRGAPMPVHGSIVLQTHGGEIAWRNIRVRPLTTTQANETLAAYQNVAYRSLFDGETLDGWVGAVDDYEVTQDGSIQCQKGRGGNLLTSELFQNFSVRLEFRLPPGGNNGLAIRAPLEGNPAYLAMTELQVLDHTHPRYANLDARQAHGSAYGMVGARRGFLRQTGQWNFQQVDVDGSAIRVELNGNEILNADLNDVSEFMAETPHPGRTRLSGHFGFAGHSDPVEFRAIFVRVLPSEEEKLRH
ncbi:MAG: DUF1080 domain-containing protein [Planctomycetota bacterium]